MLFSVYLMVVSKDAGYMELSCGIVIECFFWGVLLVVYRCFDSIHSFLDYEKYNCT